MAGPTVNVVEPQQKSYRVEQELAAGEDAVTIKLPQAVPANKKVKMQADIVVRLLDA